MKNAFLIFTALLLSTLTFHAAAQIPRTLSYQGVLTDNAGKPRPDGSYSFTFRFYTSPTGGTPIWSESKNLPAKNGLFSTVLGEQTPFGATVKFDQQYWLGIQVGNEPELAPRIALTSVGYSMSSLRADTASVSAASLADTTWKQSGANIYRLNGNVGIGTNAPLNKLQIEYSGDFSAAVRLKGDSNDDGLDMGTGNRGAFVQAHNPNFTNSGSLLLNPSGGNVGIGTFNPTTKLEVDGHIKTSVLEITGGSDLAEPFEMSHVELLPEGSLVVIDKDHPGKLKQATEPYDKRVAGVISGAGGINPGLTLTQADVLKGGQHVALSGKVYVLASAANGAIAPGDLLTTSHISGHAMKATDQARSFGAVIGKAMSSLEKGEGLVLVLVNLQ